MNPNITLGNVKHNLDKPWKFDKLCVNSNITLQMIVENLQLDLSWMAFLSNPNLCLQDFMTNPAVPCTIKDLLKHRKGPYYQEIVRKSSSCTLQDVTGEFLSTFPWDWLHVSKSPNITFDMMMNNPNVPWNRCGMCLNTNITMQIIEKHPDIDWSWVQLSENPSVFKLSPTKGMVDSVRRWYAACVIKRRWFQCITDPEYKVCRNRLLGEFGCMQSANICA
jgi:hypothetical protein